MKNKGIMRVFIALTAAVILCGASMTAYAYSDEEEVDEVDEVDIGELLTPVISPEPVPEPTPDPQPLTPPGNLTLIDDLSGEQSTDKQFITVITKSGNYFYIIIDRAGDRENVHFLDLVDEADLLAILEDEQKPISPTPPAAITEESQGQPPAEMPPAEPRSNNTPQLVIMLLVIAAVGGGAFYYFKVLKPKQGGGKKKPTPVLDEFDFDPDEDELFTDTEGADEQDGAEYGGDPDGDEEMPDFTAADETEPPSGDFTFDFGDFSTESGDKE